MADAASDRPGRTGARSNDTASTLLLGALTAAAPFAMDSYLASLPSMTHALSASTAEVQLTLSVYMYGWGVAQLFVGPLSDRFGRRPALLWALGVFVVASIGCALSRNVFMLIGGRLVQAVSMASIAVVPRAVVRDLYSGDKAAHILSVMSAGSAFVFVSVMGQGERGFGAMFGTVMLGNVSGAVIGTRVIRRLGIARQVRLGTALMLAAGLTLGVLALLDVRHPLPVIAPMFAYMLTFQLTMPPAIAGALTPFPQIAGSASSLLAFCQFFVASTAALVVGLTLDGTTRPMALTIAVASVLAFASLRIAARVRG